MSEKNGLNKNMTKRAVIKVTSSVPQMRMDVCSWNGWGYRDTKFIGFSLENRTLQISGDRYHLANKELPFFTKWVEKNFGPIDEKLIENDEVEIPRDYKYQSSKMSPEQLSKFKSLGIQYTLNDQERLFRAHGQGMHEIVNIRNNAVPRIADLVIWPTCHEEVVSIVKLADEIGVVIFPFGGGSSVTGANAYPKNEERPIVALDTCRMNSILWIDETNLSACCQSGIVGQDLERELQQRGFTCGHEPDSMEFSTLGGWVSTAASGMKKNTYGNIEDIVLNVKLVTPIGVIEKSNSAPVTLQGPDVNRIIIGSEGSFGVITDVIIKIRPLPISKRYGSLIFPNFEAGVKCLREVARQRCQPSSIRLMDNDQFQLGRSLRPPQGYFGIMLDNLKMMYITKIKSFDLEKICVATMVFEGDNDFIDAQERKVNNIAMSHGAVPAGSANGENGYRMTFVIAYIRDCALSFGLFPETVETSVPWDSVMKLFINVKKEVALECQKIGVTHHSTMARVAQIYDTGCCLYFYFVIHGKGLQDPMECVARLEEVAKDCIIDIGGSISHHHGVGKVRRKWYEGSVSPTGQNLFKATKKALDPNNIFNTLNLVADYELVSSKL